jgi:hypothetical protein
MHHMPPCGVNPAPLPFLKSPAAAGICFPLWLHTTPSLLTSCVRGLEKHVEATPGAVVSICKSLVGEICRVLNLFECVKLLMMK